MNEQEQKQIPTIKELIEGATPGPWTLRPLGRGDKDLYITEPAVAVDYDDVNHDEQLANAQFIARCSPSVMREVVEALELVNAPFADIKDSVVKESLNVLPPYHELYANAVRLNAVRRALSLLSSTANPESK
jgi:hypothetical protein